MKEFVVPDDGFVVRTESGRLLVAVEPLAEGNIYRLFDIDGVPRITLATHEDSGLLFLGDPSANGVSVSASDAVSELRLINAGNTIAAAVSDTNSELRFVNAQNAITNKLFVDEHGGQLGLGDHAGNLTISTGAEEEGGTFHLMNADGNSAAVFRCPDGKGNILLSDEDGHLRIMIGTKADWNIHLIDADGKIVWTTR